MSKRSAPNISSAAIREIRNSAGGDAPIPCDTQLSKLARTATCRLCGEITLRKGLVKYSTRHYAHPHCALSKWGPAFFARLTPWQASQFPAIVASKFGLLKDLESAITRATRSAL